MNYIIINRHTQDDYQTLGDLSLFSDETDREIFRCKTLELPWKDNQTNTSRIPAGHYIAVKHHSPKFGDCIWIKNVEGRTEILIHVGNFKKDTLGCILVGKDFIDIDQDGHKDVTSSANTMASLLDHIDGDKLEIYINDNFECY